MKVTRLALDSALKACSKDVAVGGIEPGSQGRSARLRREPPGPSDLEPPERWVTTSSSARHAPVDANALLPETFELHETETSQ